ncbi:hypothetical protein BKA24_001777 [Microbacterium marinum]|uniref:DUF4157 domain-containing protein n=1 Tax=Microbacterium marinum TaxID=421115 RepID=A0A7W7BSV0_9MICO|nr:hypothetical protein [Microbacterium marinum]MBB4667068.1 hypothetical protein [Microbacterium marinum]
MALAGVAAAIIATVCITHASVTAPSRARSAIPAQPALTAPQILAGIGAHDVEVVFTSDVETNCGAAASDGGNGGCFHSATPNTIYLSPGLTPTSLRYLTLHEYAHVTQHRDGTAMDECEADRLAIAWGADPRFAHYLPTCPTPEDATR